MKEFVIYYVANKNSHRDKISLESGTINGALQGYDVWLKVLEYLTNKHGKNSITSIKIVSKENDFYNKGIELDK